MITAAYVVALLAAAATCSLGAVLAVRRGSRSLALVAVLASACLLALGYFDWRAQPSIETDIKAYVLMGTLPIAVTAFAISILDAGRPAPSPNGPSVPARSALLPLLCLS